MPVEMSDAYHECRSINIGVDRPSETALPIDVCEQLSKPLLAPRQGRSATAHAAVPE